MSYPLHPSGEKETEWNWVGAEVLLVENSTFLLMTKWKSIKVPEKLWWQIKEQALKNRRKIFEEVADKFK